MCLRGGRHLNLQGNGNLSCPTMEDSQMSVSSPMVGKWYFREKMRKPKVPVNVQKETEKEKGKATDICGGTINRDQVLLKHFFFLILAKETNSNGESNKVWQRIMKQKQGKGRTHCKTMKVSQDQLKVKG